MFRSFFVIFLFFRILNLSFRRLHSIFFVVLLYPYFLFCFFPSSFVSFMFLSFLRHCASHFCYPSVSFTLARSRRRRVLEFGWRRIQITRSRRKGERCLLAQTNRKPCLSWANKYFGEIYCWHSIKL